MIETSRVSGRLIRQCQDRNYSSAYTNDYVFSAHGHLLAHLDELVAKMFIGVGKDIADASRVEKWEELKG